MFRHALNRRCGNALFQPALENDLLFGFRHRFSPEVCPSHRPETDAAGTPRTDNYRVRDRFESISTNQEER